MGIFSLAQNVVSGSAGIISGSLDLHSSLTDLQAFGGMAGSGFSAYVGSTYLATDDDLTQADLHYTELETDYEISNSVQFTHDPYELAAFLTAVYGDFTYDDVQDVLNQIFEQQTAESKTFTEVISGMMTDDQYGVYELLLYSKGNRQYIASPFDFNWQSDISSYYGYRVSPITGAKELHNGIDIPVPVGTDVHSGIDGVVSDTGWNDNYGNYIIIDNSDGISVKYEHCDEILAAVGQKVKSGEVVAKSGDSGADTTGAHLHMEAKENGKYINPLYFTLNGGN